MTANDLGHAKLLVRESGSFPDSLKNPIDSFSAKAFNNIEVQ